MAEGCLACVAVFSVFFQASGSRTRHVAEVTKILVAGGRSREGKEKPAAELRHFTERPNCFRSLGTSTVTSTVTRDPVLLHPTQFIPSLFRRLEKHIYFACIFLFIMYMNVCRNKKQGNTVLSREEINHLAVFHLFHITKSTMHFGCKLCITIQN